MKIGLDIIVGFLFTFLGWGWAMSRRWVILMFRTLTIECALLIPVLLYWDWIKTHSQFVGLITIPFVTTPLFFFLELIPFPVLQFFKANGVTTIRIEKKFAKESFTKYHRDMKYSPHRFIYPYIQGINVSPIINGQEYITIRCCLFNALPYHFELSNVRISLTVNGTPTEKHPIFEDDLIAKNLKTKKSLTLYAENSNELSELRIYLPVQRREELLKYFRENDTVQACLNFHYEKNGKIQDLSTNRPNIALLNGAELYKCQTTNP